MSQQTNEPGVPEVKLHHRLAIALEHGKCSVAEMATETGYSVKMIGNYLHDRNVPRDGVLRVWAMRCGVQYRWLKDGLGSSGPTTGGSDLGITESGCIADTPGVVIPLRRAA